MTYGQTRSALRALLRRYPEAFRLLPIGESLQGRYIHCAVIGCESAQAHILVQAAMHGREHATADILLYQMERLLKCGVPTGACFHMIPLMNPDGAEICVHQRPAPYLDSLYRNDPAGEASGIARQAYFSRWKANARGVDLNRNFPAGFARVATVPAPAAEGYRGKCANSEPETRALMRYAKNLPLALTLSYHAAGREIYYEFCLPPKEAQQRQSAAQANAAGKELAYAAAKRNGYMPLPDGGHSFGGFKDWMIYENGVPSLTIEFGCGPCPLSRRDARIAMAQNRSLLPAMAALLTDIRTI